jgi:hypothetical protein
MARLGVTVALVAGCTGGDRKPSEFRMTTESC